MSTVEAAKVALPLPSGIPCATVITLCTDQSAIIKKCTAYGSASAVQATVADLDAAVATLQGIDADLTQAKALVATLDGKREVQIGVVRLKHDSVESALNTASNGDPVAAKAWVGQTKTRAKPLPVGASTAAPEKPAVRNVKRHPGMVEASCAEEPSVVGYAYQWGTDPTHPENWAAQVVARGHTFKVANLPIGQTLYFRMAVIRRGSIQGQWSPLVQIQVR